MIRLFNRLETDFTTNGIRALQPIECIVTEELNGDYSLKITMPTWDTKIQNESIIKAPTPKGDQLFRVYNTEIDALGNNVYSARHIFYDLLDNFIEDTRPTNATGAQAISAILSGTGFTGESDISATSTAYYQLMDPVSAILGGQSNDSNCFTNRWGGELERDNFVVRMKQRIGTDRGVSIRYRKNLTGLTMTVNMDSVITRIYPTGRATGGQTLLTLPEKYVDSPYLNAYVHPKANRIDYSDIEVGDDMTQEEAYAALRTAAQAEFANGLDKPAMSAKVEFVPLETTEEYRRYANLEKVYLGDTIHVYHEPLGIQLDTEVKKYEYDCLTKRYLSIELGTPSVQIGAFGSIIQQSIQHAKEEAKTTVKDYSAGIKQLNELMANALGFYKTEQKQPDGSSIYYLHNKPKLADSKIIWKLSVDGFAWTTDGNAWQNGMTADGNLVIKTISAIGIVADWIVAGILKSKNGKVYFDLDGNEASVSKLVSATEEATDVAAAIGLLNYEGGGTAKGLSLMSSDVPKDRGGFVFFAQNKADALGNNGADINTNGTLSLMSDTTRGSNMNILTMSTGANLDGDISIQRAQSGRSAERVFHAYSGETDIHGRNVISLATETGSTILRQTSEGWRFYAGSKNIGSIDGNGWNGWVNGVDGMTLSTALQGSSQWVHLTFTHGLLTDVSYSS